ncbi:MAG: helix-turn-helix transcriptional regulator [Dehalococcoidia bacterium]
MIVAQGTWAEWRVGKPGTVALGRYLKCLRTRRGESLRKVGLGSIGGPGAASQISKFERGHSAPKAENLRKLAHYFGLPSTTLLLVGGMIEDPVALLTSPAVEDLRSVWIREVGAEARWLSDGALEILSERLVWVADSPNDPQAVALVDALRPLVGGGA